MSPELTLGQQYDSSVDVFAFGILAFIVMTGNFFPYASDADNPRASTPVNVQMIVATDPSCRPNLKESTIEPEWARSLCSSCWDNDVQARPTFGRLVEILKKEKGQEDTTMIRKSDDMHFSEEIHSKKARKDEKEGEDSDGNWHVMYEELLAKHKKLQEWEKHKIEKWKEMEDRLTTLLKENEMLNAGISTAEQQLLSK